MLEPPLPPDEPQRLRALHALGLLDTPPEERFERIVRMARELLDMPMVLVSLVDAERQWFKARCGLDLQQTPRRISFCAHAILGPGALVVPDTLEDVRFRDNPLVTEAPQVRFYAGQPLHAPDGSRVGTLCVLDTQPRQLGPRERRQLADLGAWAEGELHTLTLRQARAALLQQQAERARVERMKSEFVATVSHELRTPLTSIRGSLGLLAGGVAGPLPESARQMVRIALANSERLVLLVNDILDLEKVERGELHFALKVLEPEALLRQAVEAAQGLAQAAGVRLALQVEASGARICADADRLLQVLANLLSNAVKFSPAGGQVTARLTLAPRAVRLSVEDEGPGVPEAFRARLFERFAQADSSDTRACGGTGLGLAISRALVTGMGGRLEYSPREGGGSHFWLELPPTEPTA